MRSSIAETGGSSLLKTFYELLPGRLAGKRNHCFCVWVVNCKARMVVNAVSACLICTFLLC